MNIKEPTLRKLRNRSLTPIRYRTEDEVRHGWIVDSDEKIMRIQLVGEERPRVLKRDEQRFVSVVGEWK